MDFSFTEEQQMLQDSIRRYLESGYTLEHRARILAGDAGWSPQAWRELADLGLLALDVDEADGGIGAGPVGTMLVSQATGASLLLEPFHSSAVLATRAVTLLAQGERPAAGYFVFAPVVEASCGRPERAKQLCDEGVLHYPYVAPLLLHSGAIRERSGSPEEAEVFYRRAVEEDPELPQARKALGDALYRRGAYADAVEQYTKAVELRPDLGDDVHLKLGNVAYKQGDRERALRWWERAIEMDPGNGIARTNLELVRRVLPAVQ